MPAAGIHGAQAGEPVCSDADRIKGRDPAIDDTDGEASR